MMLTLSASSCSMTKPAKSVLQTQIEHDDSFLEFCRLTVRRLPGMSITTLRLSSPTRLLVS
jgi:hypothetical protein